MDGAVKPKILVTRPQLGAEKTAKRLSDLGMEPVVLPFTETVKLEQRFDEALLRNTDAVLVTSANALRHLDLRLFDLLKNRPVYAVGDSTRDVAIDMGMHNVVSANGGAPDLLKLVSNKLIVNSSIVYLCGQTRTDDVEKYLSRLGINLTVVETYQTIKVSQLTYKLKQLTKRHTLDGVLLYSGISANILGEVWPDEMDGKSTRIPMLFCISERAKISLPPAIQNQVVVCAQPRDDVMVETVEKYFRSKAQDL
jgi:uroporphyrinogen-III synthase